FIPSAIAIRLSQLPDTEVVAVDNLSTGDLRKLELGKHPGLRFIKCDVNRFQDISAVFYAYRPQFVFHYAAVVGVKRTTDHPVN
ncbi:MAG TPA: NAD-dependent epimerase/dehydratase family protein, partial [Flavobacteriales bacterium]|nr:NAD-dependent epimerase/dehydratase family protein [Flavobacteriales bacterium]